MYDAGAPNGEIRALAAAVIDVEAELALGLVVRVHPRFGATGELPSRSEAICDVVVDQCLADEVPAVVVGGLRKSEPAPFHVSLLLEVGLGEEDKRCRQPEEASQTDDTRRKTSIALVGLHWWRRGAIRTFVIPNH
jgi:hypothetical protein